MRLLVGGLLGSLGMVLTLGLPVNSATAAAPVKLRYGYEKDQEYYYKVKITGDLPEEELTREGTFTYKVLSATDKQFVLRNSGQLSLSQKYKGNSRIIGSSGFGWGFRRMGPFIGPNTSLGTTLSRTGTVIEERWENHLPFLLGTENVLVIEPLAEEPQASWHKETDLRVVEYVGPSRVGLYGVKTGAKERTDYTILDQKDDTVRISKKYTLQTAEDAGVRYIDMSGTGELQFDLKRGVFSSVSMNYKIQVNEKNVTMTVPVTLSCQMLSDAEAAEWKKKTKAEAEARAEAEKPKAFEAGECERLLAELRSGDEKRIKAAAQRLAKTIPDDQAPKVSAALARAVKGETDAWVLAELLKAAKVWPGAELEKRLIEATKNSQWFVRDAAVAALGEYKTLAAAEIVGAEMTKNRRVAGAALRKMGRVAEPVAIALLDNPDHWVRSEAYDILGEIGGKKSLAALKKRAPMVQPMERHAFDKALAAINRRQPDDGEDEEAAGEDEKSSAADTSAMRTWHDATRSFAVEAKLLSCQDGKVTLQRKDGRKITLSLEKLCDEDQEFVKKQPKPTNPFE